MPPPYAVTPTDGYLAAGGSMQLNFAFKPTAVGEFDEAAAVAKLFGVSAKDGAR